MFASVLLLVPAWVRCHFSRWMGSSRQPRQIPLRPDTTRTTTDLQMGMSKTATPLLVGTSRTNLCSALVSASIGSKRCLLGASCELPCERACSQRSRALSLTRKCHSFGSKMPQVRILSPRCDQKPVPSWCLNRPARGGFLLVRLACVTEPPRGFIAAAEGSLILPHRWPCLRLRLLMECKTFGQHKKRISVEILRRNASTRLGSDEPN